MQNVVKEKNVSWMGGGGGRLPASPALCNKQVCTYIGYCGRDLGQSLPHCQPKHVACSHHGASSPYITNISQGCTEIEGCGGNFLQDILEFVLEVGVLKF